jgi:hypothetical protein
LKPEVLSTAIDASSLPSKSAVGRMLRIGKCSANSVPKIWITFGTTDAATTSWPVCGALSKPQ